MDVFCVFYRENGGTWLEKIFKDSMEAQYYIEAQPERYQIRYHFETWEVE